MNWFDIYNDFSMLAEFKPDTCNSFSHYTNLNALISILENKCFWATDIDDFKDNN